MDINNKARIHWACRRGMRELDISIMDETYVKVNGRWAYLYRAVDSRGRTVDFYLSSRRNSKAALLQIVGGDKLIIPFC